MNKSKLSSALFSLLDDGVCHEAARNYDCYYDGNDCIPHSGGQYERRLQYFNTGACSKEMILKVGRHKIV